MLSVVVPCFNHGRFLESTVQSVLDSTWTDLEIIIVDDGSKDDSREVGEALAARYGNVHYFYQENGGHHVHVIMELKKQKAHTFCLWMRMI